MIDISALLSSTESALLIVSKQAFDLASGLQNAAPGDDTRAPNKSVHYLFEMAEILNEYAEKCKKLSDGSAYDQANKLFEYIEEVTKTDIATREKFGVKDKFRFIRDQLLTLQNLVAANVQTFQQENVKKEDVLAPDDTVIFVYLYNAQGLTIDAWRKMVHPSVFYEHSVNRPIYTEKTRIEYYINRKVNKLQHAYLAVAIKSKDILPDDATGPQKDIYDNPIIKVREGSLKVERVISFTHNGIDYELTEEGALVRKIV